jgi:acetyl esterase/lipase
MMRLFTLAITLLSCGLMLAQDKPANQPESPRPAQRRLPKSDLPQPSKKIVYRQVGDKELLLHIFEPTDRKPNEARPAIVFFHGGAWSGGDPDQFYVQCAYLAKRGMWAATAQYRLSKEGGRKAAYCLDDARAALRYVREHAKELGIEPDRVVAAGGSAGGHLAAATALNPEPNPPSGSAPSCRPNLLVLFNPAIGSGYTSVPVEITYFTEQTPPCIQFYGTQDGMLKSGVKCVEEAKKHGLDLEVYTAEGQNHGFFNSQPWLDRTLYQTEQFLTKHGYLQGESQLKLGEGVALQRVP